MSQRLPSAQRGFANLRAGLDHLWIEEKVVWAAALLTYLLFAIVDLPFSIRLVAGGYALFLGRIAAIVVLIVAIHRIWMRFVRKVTYEPFTLADVWHFLRSLGFYIVALTTYTNLKTHTLLLNSRVYDSVLETLDRWMFLGHSPTEMALALTDRPALTALMDTSYANAWVPLAVVFGVVFSQRGGEGFRWLARVVSLNYLIGAALYVALPAVGPAFAQRELYEGLRQSRSFLIQNSLIHVNNLTIADPRNFMVPAFMGIAAFPSLHLSHIYLPMLVAWKRAKPLFYLFLLPFLAVAMSTVYFGWHWVIDIPAGIASIHLCLWLARRMEVREAAARERRQARSAGRIEAETLGSGLAQWPVPAVLGGLHFVGLMATLALVPLAIPISWGTRAALIFFLCFLVLFEICLAIAAVALLEGLARGRTAARVVDVFKSLALATMLGLVGASMLKLALTGSHLARLDLWFLSRNLGLLVGESLGTELAVAAGLLIATALFTFAIFRAFQAVRRRPAEIPLRSFLLLGLLALLGLAYSAYRYPAVTTVARSVAPEIGWTMGDRVAAPEPPDPRQATTPLSGPPIVDYAPQAPGSRPNIVLIMLESVPARILEAEEAPLAIPNLLALAEESVTFRRAYAPSVHSDYAQMAILSSLHPRKYPAHDFYERLDYPRTLLWDALAPAGWNAAMFSCQNESWGNMIRYLSTAGLMQLRHSPDWPNALHHGRGSESKVYEATVVGAWQDWLASGASEPWLSYLNFQATHFPYETPINAPRPFTPDEIDFAASFLHYPRDKVDVVRNRYLNALHYADRYVGEVIRVLKQRGEWENTILAVVSDHGEAFYEHGHPTHGTSLFEEQVRSLMMVRFPGQPGRVVTKPVSLMDLAPSLIRRLGLTEHGNFQGRGDIFEPGYSAAGRPFYFTIQGLTDEDGILVDDWKYIVNWRTGSRQMYHLPSDPGEKDDRAAVDPGRADRLHQQLMDFLSRQLAYYDRQGWKQGQYPAALP